MLLLVLWAFNLEFHTAGDIFRLSIFIINLPFSRHRVPPWFGKLCRHILASFSCYRLSLCDNCCWLVFAANSPVILITKANVVFYYYYFQISAGLLFWSYFRIGWLP